jgi:hypothetical protein
MKVKPVKQAKLLGTAAAGGARRTVKVQKARIKAFRSAASRLKRIRRAGINTTLMTRACGTQAVKYGYDTQGVSNTGLLEARRLVKAAATATAAGKNVDLAMYALDAHTGTLDPAFEGNAAAIVQWAQAHWENWIPSGSLEAASWNAKRKI